MWRVILAVLAVFVLWVALDFVIHGILLGSTYAAHPELFRPQAEMKMPLLWLVVLTHAAVFVKIYSWLVTSKSLKAGVLLGLLWGTGHGIGMGFGMYATLPIPINMAVIWCIGAMVEATLAGVATALIVRDNAEPAV